MQELKAEDFNLDLRIPEVERNLNVLPKENYSSYETSVTKNNSGILPDQWDNNWDLRSPKDCVAALTPNATEKEKVAYQKDIKQATPTATRTYVLVRHGQYENKTTDEERILTPLGRQQADATGDRLATFLKHKQQGKNIDLHFTMSTMTRATETAEIILQHFPDKKGKSCDLIREGAPCKPVPKSTKWNPEPTDYFADSVRIEAGFRKYIHRADLSQERHSIDVLVCHGNVIRYFVCRALQLPPEAWARFVVLNASITTITVHPNGKVSVSGIGETGHLPPNMCTSK